VTVCAQAAFLIPISVCVYTTTGGLKATFLSSYIHTVIIYVALCIFAFTVYATGSDLGSPSKVSHLTKYSDYPKCSQGVDCAQLSQCWVCSQLLLSVQLRLCSCPLALAPSPLPCHPCPIASAPMALCPCNIAPLCPCPCPLDPCPWLLPIALLHLPPWRLSLAPLPLCAVAPLLICALAHLRPCAFALVII